MTAGCDDWADGEGWVSDEGPFLGSEKTRSTLAEEHPCKSMPRPSTTPLGRNPRTAKPSSSLATPKSSNRSEPLIIEDDDDDDLDSARPSKRARHTSAAMLTPKATATSSRMQAQAPGPGLTQTNVLDLLKNRPQLAKLEKKTKPPVEVVSRGTRNVAGDKVKDLVPNNGFEGASAAWQQSETVVEFLRRLPVESPATASEGHWLWVGSPQIPRHWLEPGKRHDHNAFMDTATLLFADFHSRRAQIEKANPGKAPAQITRKLGPDKDVLESKLLKASVTFGETSGKWMLFPGPSDLPRVWRLVAEATAAGELGPTSKAGTWEPGNDKKGTLICVYTYDFTDLEDIRRVLDKLVDLGLVSPKLKTIYYKCDAYTYLSLGSDNEYKIRASLWSSEEVLKKQVKIAEDGVITRLQKKHVAAEKF